MEWYICFLVVVLVVLGVWLCRFADWFPEEYAFRLYWPTLAKDREVEFVKGMVELVENPKNDWKFDQYSATCDIWDIWITNAKYADMQIRKPISVHLSASGAYKLRTAIRNRMAKNLSAFLQK